MELQIDKSGPITVARVSGRLHVENTDELLRTLKDYALGDGAALAVELSGVDLIDSTGLSALISLVTRARLTKGRVVLVAPSHFVAEVFAVTNLDHWFEICDTLDEAKKSLTRE